MSKVTVKKEYFRQIDKYRSIKAIAELKYLSGNKHSYFSVTAEIRNIKLRDLEACGCLHEEVAENFPELAPYIKWHLTDSTGVPMHYIANSMYWFEQGNMMNFFGSCVYGAVHGDEVLLESEYTAETMFRSVLSSQTVECWLKERLPALKSAFQIDMLTLFIGQLEMRGTND